MNSLTLIVISLLTLNNFVVYGQDWQAQNVPLILTPFLERGQISEARRASAVNLDSLVTGHSGRSQSITSYSGFFNVNKGHNSSLFFWFFESQHVNPLNAPIVLWLAGGPGSPSVTEAFLNGPLVIDDNLNVKIRTAFSFNDRFSILYLDNPVGAGFSFTDNDGGYAHTQDEISTNLYSALTQFYTLFPFYLKNSLYISGVSYAGKYIPSLALKIHEENRHHFLPLRSKSPINLKGLFLIGPYFDPLSQFQLADTHYEFGLYDETTRDFLLGKERELMDLIQRNDFLRAVTLMDSMYGLVFNKSSIFNLKTGFESIYYGATTSRVPSKRLNPIKVLTKTSFREALHVGNGPLQTASVKLTQNLIYDYFQSAKSTVEKLLESGNYKILILSGQLDIAKTTKGIDKFVGSLNWNGISNYLWEERKIWNFNDNVAGYYKKHGKLSRVYLNNAGHFAYYDQLELCYHLINRFTFNEQF